MMKQTPPTSPSEAGPGSGGSNASTASISNLSPLALDLVKQIRSFDDNEYEAGSTSPRAPTSEASIGDVTSRSLLPELDRMTADVEQTPTSEELAEEEMRESAVFGESRRGSSRGSRGSRSLITESSLSQFELAARTGNHDQLRAVLEVPVVLAIQMLFRV